MLDRIYNNLYEKVVSGISTAVCLLLVWGFMKIFAPIIPKLTPVVIEYVNSEVLMTIVLLFAVIILVLIFIIYMNRKRALALKYGIYWDKENNPLCPIHKTPLGVYDNYSHRIGFLCCKCNNEVHPMSISGKEVSVERARKIINDMQA